MKAADCLNLVTLGELNWLKVLGIFRPSYIHQQLLQTLVTVYGLIFFDLLHDLSYNFTAIDFIVSAAGVF